LAVPVYLWRGNLVSSSKTFASRTTCDRRPVMHIPRLKYLAELFQMFFARGAVRVCPDVQRHIQIDETASDDGETGSVKLSSHWTSDSLERVSASVDVGRFRSSRLLRRRKHAGESRWRFPPCAAGQNKRRRIKTEGHLLHRHTHDPELPGSVEGVLQRKSF